MLAIIPARGGSKGILRKNLQTIQGAPLVIWKANQVAQLPEVERIVISTDDPTIAAVARCHGYEVHDRDATLAGPEVTLGAVAWWVCSQLEWQGRAGVFQPTAPTLSVATMRGALARFDESEDDALITVCIEDHNIADQHRFLRPKVNRQYRDADDTLWRETGGIHLVRHPSWFLEPENAETILHEVNPLEAVDIDSPFDLVQARAILSTLRIEFVVLAAKGKGTGHVRRCLALADEMAQHSCVFRVVGDDKAWAVAEIEAAGHETTAVPTSDASVVVFDCLGADPVELALYTAGGIRTLTLEDVTSSAQRADVVINELLGDGPAWAVLRPEFLALPPFEVRPSLDIVGLVLGGAGDDSPLAARLRFLSQVTITEPEFFGGSVVEMMRHSDVVITGRGRTMWEAAAVGCPLVTIPQNLRETTHARPEFAVNLNRYDWEDNLPAVLRWLKDPQVRQEMSDAGRAAVDGRGAQRVARVIENLGGV